MTGDGTGHDAWRPPAPDPSRDVTESLTGYSDLHEIGVGGDSVVYHAIEDNLGRAVAIKVLNVDDEVRAARFAREVDITLDLGRQHPNIVTVLATGRTGTGRPAIVMEFYPDGTLHDRLREFGPLPVDEVVRIGLVLADALSFAHDRGVLHRDVKPQNVLVLPTSWVLADFGIARLADSEHTSSVETFTYRHASPQVLDGLAPTAADDIWSLGSTLYTLVDGRPPFASDDPDQDSALAYLRRARTEPHRPLMVPGAEALAAIIDRCLVKDVEGRWASAGELHDALLGLRHRGWEPTSPTPVEPASVEPAVVDPAVVAPAVVAPAAVEPAVVEPAVVAPAVVAPAVVEPAPAPTEHTGNAWAPSAPLRREPGDNTAPRARRPVDLDARLTGEFDVPAAAPTPVALSAAAHVPIDVPVDAEPTGVGLPPEHVEAAASHVESQPETLEAPAPSRRRTVVVALGALALVVGTALGLFGSALRDDEPTQQTSATVDDDAGQPIPTLSDQPIDPDPKPDVADPDLAFEFRGLTYEAGDLVLEWQDPSDGEGFFYLSQTRPVEDLLQQFDYGQTEARVPYQLSLGRSCFVMVVRMPEGDNGVSNVRCLTNKG